MGYDVSLRGDRFLTLRQPASWNDINFTCPARDVLRCNLSLYFAFVCAVLHCTIRIRRHVLSVRMNASCCSLDITELRVYSIPQKNDILADTVSVCMEIRPFCVAFCCS